MLVQSVIIDEVSVAFVAAMSVLPSLMAAKVPGGCEDAATLVARVFIIVTRRVRRVIPHVVSRERDVDGLAGSQACFSLYDCVPAQSQFGEIAWSSPC